MMNKKTQVLQVVGTMNRGGAEVMIMDVFKNISKDIKFNFLVNYKLKTGIPKGDFDDEIINKGGRIKHIATQWDLGPIKYIKKFKKIYDELGQPEIVHIHLNAKSGIIALAAKLAGAKKIIVHSHADLKFRESFIKNTISKLELKFQKFLINKYATDFWGASEEANKSLFLENKKAIVINNAIDTEKFQNVLDSELTEFRNSLKINDSTLVFGNIGRIVKHKNVGFIIDLLSEYINYNQNFIFIYAGRIEDEEYFEKINRKIKKYKLSKHVRYLGVREDIPVILNSIDIFISPALKEGFGLVAIEAQAVGVPSLLYTGFPSTVDMGMNLVYFINNFNIDEWINKVNLISKTRKKLELDFIKKKIEEKGFDIKKNILKIEKLYLMK